MNKNIPLDPATNMPALPSPYFWRVKPVGHEPRYRFSVYVELRRKEIIGSTMVAQAMSSQSDVWGPTLADAIQARAGHVYEENFLRHPVPGADYFEALGDYPPKRIATTQGSCVEDANT